MSVNKSLILGNIVADFDDKIRLIGGKKDSTIKTEKPESNPEPEDDLPF